MFKNSSFFNPDEALEQGQAVVKKQVQATLQTAKTQISGQTQQPAGDAAQSAPTADATLTQEFITDLYAPSDKQGVTSPAPTSSTGAATGILKHITGAPKSSGDDAAKLAQTRKLLEEHMGRYYRPTFEQRPQQEERAAEKVERQEAEEQQKRWELQQEEQKKNEVPIALKMATNKAEMFRGAAG